MNKLLAAFFLVISATSFSQVPLSPLEEEAKTNKRLLPRYGLLPKSEPELEADKEFVAETMKQPQFNGSQRAASNHLIKLGFNYLYRNDLKTAMYRFNQAYLLDSVNTDIYWGYGAFYMALGNYEEGRKQYEKGLSIEPANAHLLTDYGTYYLMQYYVGKETGLDKEGMTNINKAISFLDKSFTVDKKDQNTVFKLSVCYWLRSDCEKAWHYYNICKELGGQPITEAYTSDLKKCDSKN